MSTAVDASAVPAVESISLSIAALRGQRVILDTDLATLYEVPTKRFNEAVKRNAARFPEDFRFQLTAIEFESLRSQSATLKTGRGQHRKYLPYAFTEHGAIMAALRELTTAPEGTKRPIGFLVPENQEAKKPARGRVRKNG